MLTHWCILIRGTNCVVARNLDARVGIHTSVGLRNHFQGPLEKPTPVQVLVLESTPDYCLSLKFQSLLSGIDTAAKVVFYRSALVGFLVRLIDERTVVLAAAKPDNCVGTPTSDWDACPRHGISSCGKAGT